MLCQVPVIPAAAIVREGVRKALNSQFQPGRFVAVAAREERPLIGIVTVTQEPRDMPSFLWQPLTKKIAWATLSGVVVSNNRRCWPSVGPASRPLLCLARLRTIQ